MGSSVLVVDDESEQRFLLRRILERAGHQVSEASHGAVALQLVQATHPDLVVTDVMMPVMGGLELIRQLRAELATAGIPIMVVSGDSEVASDADAVLAKPYDFTELVRVAEKLLIGGRSGQ